MTDRKGAYGASTGGDTSFRKTYDKEEYAAKAAERDAKQREEGKARAEAKAAGKTYHARAATPPDARDTEARKTRLDVSSLVGKQTLVPAGASIGKRGRGAGFYCADCDLTFKDNLQLVDHYNSRQHLIATGQTGEVKKATLEDVRERLAWLKRKKEQEKEDEVINLDERLEKRIKSDQEARDEKRRLRNEKRRKTKDGLGVKEEEVEYDGVISAATVYV
jgi:U4/U6.U5 tri-snRNP component SNU23